MLLYGLLARAFPRSLMAKIAVVVFGIGILPLLGAVLGALHGMGAGWAPLGAVTGAALACAGAASALLRLALAPVWATANALEAHARGWTVPRLPDGHHDALGVLMRRTNQALDTAATRLDESRREAEVDPLTGALNRRGFDRAMRGQGGGAVIVCDLDHFKAVNDRYGHETGDKVLRKAAACWRRQLREGDLFARVGGEEFVVWLPKATLATAARRAGELRLALSHEVAVAGRPVTASFGAAARGAKQSIDDAIERADEALYLAKRTGRNRVRLDGIETPPPRDGAAAAPAPAANAPLGPPATEARAMLR
ncbi:GGDEF domain-containing protein [Jannaschia sp. Os4]|uniref:GGDEF domain-containing protein n=1 Tax=Jannaschia sp. Os4 TaxID=2807617 RepID=UPI00193A5B04|nr:GGDEF domain-containing protein [Jannaschia sp. Os4]MBM2576786.1 GGDEF domain-containing protein [Jannaschia sp. Os4]